MLARQVLPLLPSEYQSDVLLMNYEPFMNYERMCFTHNSLVPPLGIEPSHFRLKGGCSAGRALGAAEDGGFEPPSQLRDAVFRTVGINLSPNLRY